MRLPVVILTLWLGVWGPTLAHGEKIVFVVPRYMKRSYTSNPGSSFYSQSEHGGYKQRPFHGGSKRPFFTGPPGRNEMIKNDPFINAEEYSHSHQQGGDDFDENIFTPHREVNHVTIPHGKGISHGFSFGKGYIPHDELKSGDYQNYQFQKGSNVNQLDYFGHNDQGAVKFNDDQFSGFKSQNEGAEMQNSEWPNVNNYNQETNREESKLELPEGFNKNHETSPLATQQQLFYPKLLTNGEDESRTMISKESLSPVQISNPLPTPAALIMQSERKLEPIVLKDTIDMREYVEKIEAFAKSWPVAAAGIQAFDLKSQAYNPPAASTVPNYQAFGSPWFSNNSPRSQTGSYEVMEDSVEEPSRKYFRRIAV